MTVAELIEKLQTLDPNLEVLTPGYEGGYKDIDSDFQVCNFRKNVNPDGDTRGIVL